MDCNGNQIDVLLIDDNKGISDIFKDLTKKFVFTIKFAKNTHEFIHFIENYKFRFIICDLNLDYKLEGLFIAQLFFELKKTQHLTSKIINLASESNDHKDLVKNSFDFPLKKNYPTIYNFLHQNFLNQTPFLSDTHKKFLNFKIQK